VLLQQTRDQAMEIDRQRASAQRLADELAATTYSIAHDLRSPLRALDGFSRVLEQDHAADLKGDALGLLERIRTNAQRMGRMIDGILTIARLGRGGFEPARVDVAALAQAVVSDLRRSDPDRDVVVDIMQDLHIIGDARLLSLVMQNLIGNAWKFTRHTPNARIEVGAVDDGNGDARTIFVRDNGAGFDMEFSGKLFGTFERLHRDDEFEGSGIGLATVKRAVERHGGRVWGEGEVGKGATFYFTIPLSVQSD
jgi:hypothetical protein